MSAARFKSRDDYFSKRSGFAHKIIEPKPLKKPKTVSDSAVPASLMIDVFCQTVDTFEIVGEGRFERAELSLDEAVAQHLAGELTVKVNPLSRTGKAAWNVIKFILSEHLDHPFTKAKHFAEELRTHDIPSMFEVTEGGKGDYHLWIFHEVPVDGRAAAQVLRELGRTLFGCDLEMAPSVSGDEFVSLPLQGESFLFQRRVFVNTVGKMIKDQCSLLRNVERAPQGAFETFMAVTSSHPEETTALKVTPEPEPQKKPEPPETVSVREKPSKQKVEIPQEKTAARKEPEAPVFPEQAEKIPVISPSGLPRVLIFTVHKESYGLPADSIETVTQPVNLVSVLSELSFIAGIAQITGKNITVIDMGMLLVQRKVAVSPHARMLMVKYGSGKAGMLVDSISGIETPLAAANIPQKLEVRGNFFLDRRFEIKGHPEMLSCIDPVKIIELAGAAVTVYGQKKPQPDGRFIIAAISGVYCGFPVETVKEILPCAGSAGVLRTGDFPEGLIRYQKTAVPMVDLIGKLGIAGVQKSPESRKERCLIFRGKDHLTGTRVDCIVGIMTIPGYLIDSPLNLLKHNSPIRGFAHLKDIENVVIVLDPESF